MEYYRYNCTRFIRSVTRHASNPWKACTSLCTREKSRAVMYCHSNELVPEIV